MPWLASAVLIVDALFLPEPDLKGLGDCLPSDVRLKPPLLLKGFSRLM